MRKQISDLLQLAKNTRRVLVLTWKEQPFISTITMIVSILVSLIPFMNSGALAWLIDQLGTAQEYTPEIIYAGILLVLANLIPSILFTLRSYLDKHTWLRLQEHFEIMFFKKKGAIDIARYEDPSFNDVLNTASERSIYPILNMADAQFNNVQNVIQVIVSAGILWAFEWYFLGLIIIGILPEFLVRLRYGKSIWGIFSSNAEERRRFFALRNHFEEKNNIMELKAFQNTGKFINLMQKLVSDFNSKQLVKERARAIWTIVGSFISVGAFSLVLFNIIEKVFSGDMSIGAMTFVIASIGSFTSAVSGFLLSIAGQSEMSHFATDIFKVFDTEEIIKDPENPKRLDLSSPPRIVFENVSFTYPDSHAEVLKNVSLTIEPGERIALIGINGAGKTTLTKLLARYYDPTEGRILVNGVDLKDISREEWYQYLAILSQDYANYESFTTADMIALGNSQNNTDMHTVEEAASLSEADSFINTWEQKYEQIIGKQFKKGVDPSKGQSQRLALARLFYRKPYVMVLDEPTSAVDADAEAKIFERLDRLERNQTLILISHRFSTVRSADTIAVIKDGYITEKGSHEELVTQDGLYASLFKKQAKGYQ